VKVPPPLMTVAKRLVPLRDRIVFVGGMIRGLLVTDPAAGPSRPTDDVDLIVDVASLRDYHALGAELRRLGLHEDMEDGAPICR
jgi:predicted nucleotidyltransferase